MTDTQALVISLAKSLSDLSVINYILYLDNLFSNILLVKILEELDIDIMSMIQVNVLEFSLELVQLKQVRSEEHTSELQSPMYILYLHSFPTRRSSDLTDTQALVISLAKSLSDLSVINYILYLDNLFSNILLVKILEELDIDIMSMIQVNVLEFSLELVQLKQV